MFNNDSTGIQRPVRVLFLAWGFSIHAKRRIQLFVDDPAFEVAVVSTYDYNFPGALNIQLSLPRKGPRTSPWGFLYEKLCSKIRNILGRFKTGIKLIKTSEKFREYLDEAIRFIRDLKILRHAVKDFKPDIVFLQTLLYPCYLSYFLPSSIPAIITFWNGDVIWWAKWTGIERLLKKQIVTYGVRRALAVTVNSESAFKACLGYGINENKINLIRYPGVDLERFKPNSREISRRNLGLDSKYVVLCPRGLGGYLNSDVIIAAVPDIVKSYPDTVFVFLSAVGAGEELNKHKQMAHELGIETKFLWVGHVSHDEMVDYYSAANVMVSVSSNDSLPNVMLESMACGLPVIMSDIPQIHEWVTDGHNGYLVPTRNPETLSDKIKRVFENPDGIIETFIQINRELVTREADMNKNCIKVKELVQELAKRR